VQARLNPHFVAPFLFANGHAYSDEAGHGFVSDWQACNKRDLHTKDVVRWSLGGTVVRVRVDRKSTSISLLIVLGVRRNGQKVLLANRSMGGGSEARDGKFVSKKRGIVRSHVARPVLKRKGLRLAVLNSPRGHFEDNSRMRSMRCPSWDLCGAMPASPTSSLVFLLSVPTSNLYVHGEPRGSVGKRMYIYRSGATDNCALTATKNDPRLPPAPVPDNWQFWMQIGPLQAQDGRCGFDVRAAVDGITTKGYYLFKGSSALLHERLSAISKQVGRSNA
jgi:hypothetical protein